MWPSEEEFNQLRFERVHAAIDSEIERIAREQPDLDHQRIKGHVIRIMAAYVRSEEDLRWAAKQEFDDGLDRFFSENYPGNEPSAEFEATHHLHSRVLRRLGWDQIADFGWAEDADGETE